VPYVTWDASYSVKVSRCDEDHKKLFSLINGLHDAISTGKGPGVSKQIVEELIDYTKYHFHAEERLMEKAKYPDLPLHRLDHQEFVKQVRQFKQDLAEGNASQSLSILAFLNEWLTRHIKLTDQRYSAHLNANGIH